MKLQLHAQHLLLVALSFMSCSKPKTVTPDPPPPPPPPTGSSITANFSIDKTIIYQGEEIQFTNASKGDSISCAWTFDEGTPATSTEENPLIQFKTPGLHSVELVITKGSEKSTKSATINAQVFSIELHPAVTILNADSSVNLAAVYPAGTAHKIEYATLSNTGTLSGTQFTAPSAVVSQQITLKANSDILPDIQSIATAYVVGTNDFTGTEKFETYVKNNIMLENNQWNVDDIGNFFQNTYQFNIEGKDYFGWKVDYNEPANNNVHAYPEIIYGWKPFYDWKPSTTTKLPRQIKTISKLKVDYDIESDITGTYNLAFDNWFTTDNPPSPGGIRFEFMIWEDYRGNLTQPFGDYIGDVTTSNGVYKFYKGEPTWEPEGTNWTYIAFQRVSPRTSGIVDVDELIDYLVNNGHVSKDLYLTSLEIGNESANCKGVTVVKKFDVNIQ